MDNSVEVLQASTLNKFGFGAQYRRLEREDFAGQNKEKKTSSRVQGTQVNVVKVGQIVSHIVLCAFKDGLCMIDPSRSQ